MGKKKHGYQILAGLLGGFGEAASEYSRLKEKKGDSEAQLLQALSELSLKHQMGLLDPYKQALTAESQARRQKLLEPPKPEKTILDKYREVTSAQAQLDKEAKESMGADYTGMGPPSPRDVQRQSFREFLSQSISPKDSGGLSLGDIGKARELGMTRPLESIFQGRQSMGLPIDPMNIAIQGAGQNATPIEVVQYALQNGIDLMQLRAMLEQNADPAAQDEWDQWLDDYDEIIKQVQQ